jgi:hypothetical protein
MPNRIELDHVDEIYYHLNQMEALLGEADRMYGKLTDPDFVEESGVSGALLDIARQLAQAHGTAALVIMQVANHESVRRTLVRIDRPAPWQDNPAAPPGGPLRGPEPSPGDPPPPVAP